MTNTAFHTLDGANGTTTEASFECGRRWVLLHQRLLPTDGVPMELGARAYELLEALLEAEDRWAERAALQRPMQ
jgi:DNA-binding winged helix-turn-helix (wHTH) protein